MELAAQSLPAKATNLSPLRFDAARSLFSRAFAQQATFVPELPATVLISPENPATPARRFPAPDAQIIERRGSRS